MTQRIAEYVGDGHAKIFFIPRQKQSVSIEALRVEIDERPLHLNVDYTVKADSVGFEIHLLFPPAEGARLEVCAFQIVPTFDEWHMHKYSMTFEQRWYVQGTNYDVIFRGMCRDLRDYMTDITRRA